MFKKPTPDSSPFNEILNASMSIFKSELNNIGIDWVATESITQRSNMSSQSSVSELISCLNSNDDLKTKYSATGELAALLPEHDAINDILCPAKSFQFLESLLYPDIDLTIQHHALRVLGNLALHIQNSNLILNSQIPDLLMALLRDSSDITTIQYATGTLNNLSKNMKFHCLALKDHLMERLTYLIKTSPDIPTYRFSAGCLANIRRHDATLQAFLNNESSAKRALYRDGMFNGKNIPGPVDSYSEPRRPAPAMYSRNPESIPLSSHERSASM